VSFQYSSFTSKEILKIAAEDIRSNAKIQAHDLESMFVNKIEGVTSNLQIVSSARSVQNSEFERARTLFNAAQNSTSELTNFYMWLDGEGRLVWLSNINQTTYQNIRGTDLSFRPYFIEAKKGLDNYYSSAIDSNNNVTRIYISRPMVSMETGEFLGVSVAGIRLTTFGTLLQNQLSPDTQSSVGMIDRNGLILYSGSQELIGKDVFGPEFQSILPPELKDPFNEFLRQSLQGQSGLEDFTAGNETSTIAYEPIILEGEQFGTLYVVAPHQFADNVGALVQQQTNFNTIMTMVIGSAAFAVAALVVVWNARLERVVTARTSELQAKGEELKRSYDSLAIANEQLKVHDKMQKSSSISPPMSSGRRRRRSSAMPSFCR
jgi:hypothetical protein